MKEPDLEDLENFQPIHIAKKSVFRKVSKLKYMMVGALNQVFVIM